MTTINSIRPILDRHHFDDLAVRLLALDDNQRQLMIGVLGEFSSGKSTLINAMLGKKLLPALATPTTARITEIYPINGQKNLDFFLRDIAGNLRPVSSLDFDDALLTSGTEVAIVKTAPNELIHDGYCIVDTPGLVSLDDTHTDITFGYLPFIDGAIVCQDINKGGLTASLKLFLEKSEVRPFIGRIAFFLTLSDTKSPTTITEIRNHYLLELTEFFLSIGLLTVGLDERVIAVSSKAILDGTASTENIAKIIQTTFVAHRKQITADRIAIEQRRIADEAISRLHLMRDNLVLDREKYSQRRAEINEELKQLDSDKKRVLRTLDEIHPELKEIVKTNLLPLKVVLPQKSNNEISTELASISSLIQPQVTTLLKRRLDKDVAIKVQISDAQLQASLAKLDGYVDIGKTIGTAALAMALANYGVHPQMFDSSSEHDMDTLDSSEIAGGIMVASVVNMSKGSRFGDLVKQVNPVEWGGNLVQRYFKEREIEQEINRLIADVTTRIQSQLHDYTTTQVFEPAENALRASKKQLDGLIAEERQEATVMTKRREEVANDILALGKY